MHLRKSIKLGARTKISVCFLFSGPNVNKAVLLQLQQDRAKARQELEAGSHMRQVYDNLSYEDIEIKPEPDSDAVTKKEKEESIDRFWALTTKSKSISPDE